MFNVNTGIVTQSTDSSSSSINTNINRRVQHSQFHEQKLIEKYCRESELFKIIEDAVINFTRNYNLTLKPEEALAPFLIRLDFEYTDLIKHGQQLLYLALREPLQFAEALKYSVFGQVRDLLKTNVNGPKAIDIAQLHIQWRLLDLPLHENLLFKPTKYKCPLGLALVRGILSAYTPPEILVLQSIWYCGGGCMRNAIQTSSTEAPLCPNCSRSMSEYQKLRVTENYRLIAILPSVCVETPRQLNRIYRPILHHTYDCDLKLGATYLNAKNVNTKNAGEEHNVNSDNPSNERKWRARRMPVQLADFLGSDMESTQSAQLSNVSPVVSRCSISTGATSKPEGIFNRNASVHFEPTDEEFPAVGATRSKKPKTTPTPAVEDSSQQKSPMPQVAIVEGQQYDNQQSKYIKQKQSPNISNQTSSPEKYYNNQKIVNNWLRAVQPSEMQSQQLPLPLPPLESNQASFSAPPIAAAVQQAHQSPPSTSGSGIRPTQLNPTSRPFAPASASGCLIKPTQWIPTNRPPPPLPRTLGDIHSAPVYPNVAMAQSHRPIMRTLSSFNFATANHNVVRKEIVATPASGHTKRFHERRMRREQMSQGGSGWSGLPPQLPDELMMQADLPNSGVDEDASFVRELQQAAASNNSPALQSQSQGNPLDIVSQSTLNWNAVEFQPRRESLNPSDSQSRPLGVVRPRERSNMITERRRRQRFHRTLKPDALFELVALPVEEPAMSESTGDSQEAPSGGGNNMSSQLPVPNTNSHMSSQLSMSITNDDASQSVFRLSSLPSTGVGTEASSNTPPTTIGGPSDSRMLQTGETFDVHGENSLPLLNMDSYTQQTEASLFLMSNRRDIGINPEPQQTQVPGSNNNKAPAPCQMLFLKGNAERHNVDADLNFMPPSIKKLYRLICGKYSDYAFVYALSSQLSQDCVPMECYVYLKMALLISLTSIEQDELRAPISICVICTDSCMANRLLTSIGQLAPRFIGPHEGGQQPSYSGLPSRYNWVQASPLMMAQQGVYYAGDWNRLSRDQTEELEKSMENNSLPVPQLQSEQPLEVAIWTYWQPENATNQTTAFAKLCPIFGLPVYMDELVNEVMWDFVLREHSRDSDKLAKDALHIPNEDMRTLLELIQQRQVIFTQPAEHLLKKYYIISRVQQPTAFSSKTYIVLKQFAESLAKLSMRLDVLESDVVVAIFHCEHFVRSIFGAGDFPPPAVSNFNVISRVDPYMNIFSRWLFQYMDRFEEKVV
ncbi:hypothetical protein ACLKA6_012261 [Drosophila palustris]